MKKLVKIFLEVTLSMAMAFESGASGTPLEVERVTLFPRGGEISLAIPPGPFDITLPGPFQVGTVRLNPAPGEPFPPQPQAREEPLPGWIPPALRPLADRVDELRRRALEEEASRDALGKVMEKLDGFLPEGEGALGQIQATEALRREYALRKGEADRRAQEARDLYDAWEEELGRRLPPGDRGVVVRGAGGEGGGRHLVVRTDQMGWDHLYRLELDSATGRIVGSLRAMVWNLSGVDWDAPATLHTARPSGTAALPRVAPLVVSASEKRGGGGDDFVGPPALYAPEALPAPSSPQARGRAPEREDSLRDTAFVVDRLEVPGDGTSRDLLLESFELQGEVVLVAVPSRREEAWILVEVASADRTFLGGACDLVVDGTSAGLSFMPDQGAGQPLSLVFGTAPAVKAERLSRVGSEGEAWLGGGHRDDGYRITVTNGLPDRRVVRVVDRIPTSAQEGVRVENVSISPAPVKNEEGVLTWEIPVDPGEKGTVVVSWRVTFPRDKELVFRDKR